MAELFRCPGCGQGFKKQQGVAAHRKGKGQCRLPDNPLAVYNAKLIAEWRKQCVERARVDDCAGCGRTIVWRTLMIGGKPWHECCGFAERRRFAASQEAQRA